MGEDTQKIHTLPNYSINLIPFDISRREASHPKSTDGAELISCWYVKHLIDEIGVPQSFELPVQVLDEVVCLR